MEKKENKIYVVLMCGSSGSGKSYITKKLIENYSEEFKKIPQYTTRDRRDGEDPYEYYFVNKKHYKIIQDKLICRTEVNESLYGTIPVFEEGKINIIIVNTLGIEDFEKYLNLNKEENIDVCLIRIESEVATERKNRDNEFVLKEKRDLDNIVNKFLSRGIKYIKFKNTSNKFIKVEDVKDSIMKIFNI